MKISELIQFLEDTKNKHGDLPVYLQKYRCDEYEEEDFDSHYDAEVFDEKKDRYCVSFPKRLLILG